ncbi:MAG: DnaJ domain-containing protein [Bacteroidia bacterium]
MVNYYKILGVENYSSIEQVKIAYKDKIRLYHPDINQETDAVEIAKYLNQAKDILTDEHRKTAYDYQLKLAYLSEIQKLKTKLPSFWSKEKNKRKEAQKLRERERYIQSNARFPYRLRMLTMLVFMFAGLQLIYSNYFVMHPGYEAIYSLLGFVIFAASSIILSNLVYTHYWVRSVDKVIKFNYEQWIGRILILVLVCGPASIYGLNEYRKSFYLQSNYEYYLAEIDPLNKNKGIPVFRYTIDGTKYSKRLKYSQGPFIILSENKLLIKYAKVDPRIAKPVKDKAEFEAFRREKNQK